MKSFLLFLLTLLGSTGRLANAQSCAVRDYGNGGTVCVCNTTYCDTISRPQPVPRGQFIAYTSNIAGVRLQPSVGRFQNIAALDRIYQQNSSQVVFGWDTSANLVFVNSTTKYQTVLGFGGGFTDASAININALPATLQDSLLRSLFSEEGIEYNLGRVPIGGSDFSTRAYSYDDGPEDQQLVNFRLAPEDLNLKIPLIRRALQLTNGQLELVGTAWAAPKWIKTNGEYSGYGFLRRTQYQTWADYHVRFLDAYQQQNISFWGLTTGNQPSNAFNPFDTVEVVGWPSWLMGGWISQNLGPTIRASNYSGIKLLTVDDTRIFLPWYLDQAFANNDARGYIDGVAVQWYLDEYVDGQLLTDTQMRYPEKFLLATEASIIPTGGESPVVLGSWNRGEKYSWDIIQDMLHYVTGWIDSNLALNMQGGPNYVNNTRDGVIIVNPENNEFYKQPLFYHLAHFSKFIPRGSVRVRSFGNNGDNFNVVAFQRPDKSTAVILLNKSADPIPVNVTDVTRGSAALQLTPRSITTLLYW